MSVDLKHAFRLSFLSSEAALPMPPVSEILARLRSSPVWDSASIAPADGQFPLLHIEWHEGHGFVIQCYEDEQAWSDFVIAGDSCGLPTVEINLGGQALERWPSELFVPEQIADQALEETESIPPGWNDARVQRVLEHYDAQSDIEAVAEDEAAYRSTTTTVMNIPVKLVPVVTALLARRI